MVAIDSVIFDFDGVLVDSEVISLSELNRSLLHFGIKRDWQDLVTLFLGRSEQAIAAYIEAEAGVSSRPEYPEESTRRVLNRFKTDLQLLPGVLALLDWLDQLSVPYCIASGSSPGRLAYALECAGLDRYFAGKAFSGDLVEKGKPAPDIFQYCLEKMGADPARCLVIEDGTAGTIGARAAHIDAVFGFVGGSHLDGCRGFHEEQLCKAGASRIISSLADVEALFC